MDPVSILGVVGTTLSVATVVTQTIQKLGDLKSRYRNVPLQVSTLIGQLYIVQAALEQISSWSAKDLLSSPRYQELAVKIDTSLDCFCPLILTLQQHLDDLNLPQDIDLTARSKFSFLWNEQDLMGYLGLLDRQVNALNLFLQAIQCKTLADQRNFVNDDDSRTVLQQAKDCNTSIIGMSDNTSILSEGTNIHTVSLEFDFDAVILGSRAYRSAHRSNLKRVITTARVPQSSFPPNAQDTPISSLENQLEGSLSAILPSADGTGEQTLRGESPSVESDQNALQLSQNSTTGNRQIDDDYPSHRKDLTRATQQSVTSPTTVQNAANMAGSSSNSQFKRNMALRVGEGRSTAPSKAVVTPRSTLVHSLKKSWRTRMTKPTVSKILTEQAGTKVLAEHNYIKLLILGSSESGKSTLLKGMRLYEEGGCTKMEAIQDMLGSNVAFSEIIWNNIIQSIRVILEAMESLEIPLQHEPLQQRYHVQTIFMQPDRIEDNFPAEVGTAVAKLWADPGVQEAYRRRCEYQTLESVPYFASHVERLAASGYMPSLEDALRSRVKTTGITETNFEIGGSDVPFKVFDMGGVRSERKNWIHAFENVDCILFTVDASAYCRLLFEDEMQNRMQEQLTLWDSIVNSRWFTKTSFVLIFTKIDWLPEQLPLYPISNYFTDFKEPESGDMSQRIDSYLAFLKDRFLSLAQSEESLQRIRVMYADLIHVDDHNPAGAVLEAAFELWSKLRNI